MVSQPAMSPPKSIQCPMINESHVKIPLYYEELFAGISQVFLRNISKKLFLRTMTSRGSGIFYVGIDELKSPAEIILELLAFTLMPTQFYIFNSFW